MPKKEKVKTRSRSKNRRQTKAEKKERQQSGDSMNQRNGTNEKVRKLTDKMLGSDEEDNEWEDESEENILEEDQIQNDALPKKKRGRNSTINNSDEAKQRRLEKNRDSAKESRKRKK